MSTSIKANQDTIIISSDDDDSCVDEACDVTSCFGCFAIREKGFHRNQILQVVTGI